MVRKIIFLSLFVTPLIFMVSCTSEEKRRDAVCPIDDFEYDRGVREFNNSAFGKCCRLVFDNATSLKEDVCEGTKMRVIITDGPFYSTNNDCYYNGKMKLERCIGW